MLAMKLLQSAFIKIMGDKDDRLVPFCNSVHDRLDA